MYSGRLITAEEASNSNSEYILYINKNTCLDARGEGHMAGRYINDGKRSGLPTNARFGASLRYYVCRETGRFYVSVFATKPIHPKEEILSSYGRRVTWHFPIPRLPRRQRPPSDDEDEENNDNPKKKAKSVPRPRRPQHATPTSN